MVTVGYMDVREESSVQLRCLVRYMNVKEGSRAKMGCAVCYMALDPYVMPHFLPCWCTPE